MLRLAFCYGSDPTAELAVPGTIALGAFWCRSGSWQSLDDPTGSVGVWAEPLAATLLAHRVAAGCFGRGVLHDARSVDASGLPLDGLEPCDHVGGQLAVGGDLRIDFDAGQFARECSDLVQRCALGTVGSHQDRRCSPAVGHGVGLSQLVVVGHLGRPPSARSPGFGNGLSEAVRGIRPSSPVLF